MDRELTDDLVGKSVTTDEGQEMGTIAEVDEGHIYVDLMGGGETQHDEDIDAESIKEITDDEVILHEPEQT
ncbi:hypothetical protein [Natrialba asiatica]|uniref:PRC-barrel domain-containing protein n=1 Tax=Natrialba asiatica (strain ATCC 700177 / DSM 12278 / JCM 9576 / FERM P-10747 / NBRC 102637 / 172P1) TaxID=29540 RepID=M0B5R2_NATA1|nr:hypothetical protein [Natrialba asiatica]ELZ06145.1 hypothetical protein C481_01395 [Natrialba asiatica DSM 12278]